MTKNITLSADKELIAKARAYARSRGLSLNELMRDYMRRITGSNADQAAEEFAELARSSGARSPNGYRFDRKAAHVR